MLLLAIAADGAAAGEAEVEDWKTVAHIGPVEVLVQPTETGPDRFRASVAVCSDLDTVAAYIANVDNFMDWIAYAEEAQVLESGDSRTLYYLKSSAPWPMRSRDMVYELKPRFDAGGTLHIAMRGLPDELPERRDAVRMDSVEGDWQFSVDGSEISVQLTLQVDPGRVAKFLANRRIASTVGLTLQALGDRFPCSTRLTVPD